MSASRRLRGRASVAASAVFALVALMLTAAPAHAENTLAEGSLRAVPDVAPLTFVDDRLPVLDSSAGWGSALAAEPGGKVSLRGSADGRSSALLRLTLPEVTVDTALYTGDPDRPTMLVRAGAGQSVSTTALFPVVDGSVTVWGSVPTDARIETIAAFDGSEEIPGSIIALTTPVVRADTAVGLGGPGLVAGEPLPIGVTGEGGVRPDFVRAIFATVTATLSQASSLEVNELNLELPRGSSSVTSLFVPDANGMITAELAEGSGSLRLDVLGWIPEAATDLEQANVIGGFVNSSERGSRSTARIADSADVGDRTVAVSDSMDSSHSLVMLAAAPSSRLALLDFGEPQGRGHGIAVDPFSGALPQLAIAPSDGIESVLSVTRGAVGATVYPLGDFLDDSTSRHAADPTIEITAPITQSAIDLGENGVFTIEGSVTTPGASIDRIEISVPTVGVIGTAQLHASGAGESWSFEAAAPDDGEFDYIATVFDRSGRSASDEVSILITAADDEDIVVDADTVVVNEPGGRTMRLVGDNLVSFEEQPDFGADTVLVSGITETLPDGYFARVVSINRVDNEWIVATEEASIVDVFFQADIREQLRLDESSAIGFSDDDSSPEGDEVDYRDVDDGQDSIGTVTGTDVDINPYENTADGGETPGTVPLGVGAADLAARAKVALRVQPTLKVEWGSDSPLPAVTNLSDASEARKDAERAAITPDDDGGEITTALLLELDAQAALELDIVVDITMKWKWKFIPAGVVVNDFRMLATTVVKAEAAITASVSYEREINLTKDLYSANLPSIQFLAGVVPVVITNELTIGLMVDLSLAASITIPAYGVTRTDVNGFSFSDHEGMHALRRAPLVSYKDLSFDGLPNSHSAMLAGSVAVGPRLSFSSRMYSLFGPTIYAGAQAGVEGTLAIPDLSRPKEITGEVSAFLMAKIGGRAQLKVLKWLVVDIPIAEARFRHELFRKNWGTVPDTT